MSVEDLWGFSLGSQGGFLILCSLKLTSDLLWYSFSCLYALNLIIANLSLSLIENNRGFGVLGFWGADDFGIAAVFKYIAPRT